MPSADFFVRLGILAIRDFFDADLCERLRTEVAAGVSEAAWIVREGTSLIDENVRRSRQARVSEETATLVRGRLRDVKSQVENHFHLSLSDWETPTFLVYQEGDFFGVHQDTNEEDYEHEWIARRRVSVVVFLNGESAEPGPDVYSGGSLMLYGLIDQPRWKTIGLPLVGERGLLVAFRSDLAHEVTPVTRGTRYTIVSWYR
jgi:predicted 2-oxoglutarate/Fe(II)-dependent dioxygenase YbiX